MHTRALIPYIIDKIKLLIISEIPTQEQPKISTTKASCSKLLFFSNKRRKPYPTHNNIHYTMKHLFSIIRYTLASYLMVLHIIVNDDAGRKKKAKKKKLFRDIVNDHFFTGLIFFFVNARTCIRVCSTCE